MTYPLIVAPFALVGAIAFAATARRPGLGMRLTASVITAVVLVVLTVIFDNAMIAAGLFTYPDALISGIRVGLAPIEDLSYPIVAAFAVPAVAELLRPPRRAPSPTDTETDSAR
ncbi:lycopene cyclase domain-containing protein [uncultured Microbacterium sp.]|uniref:lycopene cyclase domain-containing protein n=1 Tax=uncultured Microbacterium sp. TaxID=191216 RepID=UPI0025E28085|nr:lycopene cyclase domain-containing protein [uncultured Microbacterium sp.]